MSKMRWLLLITLALLLAGMSLPVTGQGRPAMTFGMPLYMSWMVESDAEFMSEFEAQYPGTRFELVKISMEIMDRIYQAETANEMMDALADYYSSADVLFISPFETLRPEVTIANYLLDLTPLVSADTNLDPSAYRANTWESLQWDGGQWGVPSTANVSFLIYDPQAFDEAGLAYPTTSWNLVDLEYAIRTLTTFAPDGTIQRPGFMAYGQEVAYLLQGLTGQTFADTTQEPAPPRFSTPEIQAVLETWTALKDEGYIPGPNTPFSEAPAMRLGGFWEISNDAYVEEGRVRPQASLFPGGLAPLDTLGFGISAGTTNPELAYALAQYLAEKSAVYQGTYPALINLVAEDPDRFYLPQMSPEAEALLDRAYANALTAADMRYSQFVTSALEAINDGEAPMMALQEAEIEATDYFNTALSRQATPIFVAEAPPEVIVGPGQTVLTVGIDEFMISSNQTAWDLYIEEFLAAHPDIAAIDMSGFGPRADDMDCFYSNSYILNDGDFDNWLNLDPFMDADPNFAQSDLVAGVMDSLLVDGRAWGYPLSMSISAMWIDPNAFATIGRPLPENGWTLPEFEAVVEDMAALLDLEEGQYPFMSFGGNQALTMLITAYGGQLWDYSTSPATPIFTAPENVAAIQQVLDMAVAGQMQYFPFEFSGPSRVMADPRTAPILGDYISRYSMASAPEGYLLTTYPIGEIMPVDYNVDIGIITKQANNPEACYDFMAGIAAQPELLGGMPVFRSRINQSDLNTQSAELVSFYNLVANQLESYPSRNPNGAVDYMEFRWLNIVFDAYVLEGDTDLANNLQEAVDKIDGFRECTSAIEGDPNNFETQEEFEAYWNQINACGEQVDPDFQALQ